jgi:alpha-L-fucosidase 2
MRFRIILGIGLSLTLVCLLGTETHNHEELPEHGLDHSTPAKVWDEALPLGNGLLGALVWGDGKPLNISLDRTDLWDLRPVPEFFSDEYSYDTMRRWVKEGRIEDLRRVYEAPYRRPGPTKIPAGRIELEIGDKKGDSPLFSSAVLDVLQATASVDFEDDTQVQVFTHADSPAGVIRVTGPGPVKARIKVPEFGGPVENADPQNTRVMEVGLLGYAPPEIHALPNWTGYVQQGWGEFRFAVALMWTAKPGRWLGVWSIATSEDQNDPLSAALRNCETALGRGYETLHRDHKVWWDRFWRKSWVRVPNPTIERQWYLETYKFGSCARSDTPPITLQGPWTADSGLLPPWKGDYHHDLNTELSYWPAYSGNRLEGAEGFVNWLWDTRETAREWTERFFGLPGLNIPMTADLNQNQIGGWHQYTHSATTAAWLAHHFYLHWRYSWDREFLRKRAYPWLKLTAEFLEAVTELKPDGQRTLPLSSSPEINDNRLDAWFPEITNYDLSLIRFVFAAAAELAGELRLDTEARYWLDRLAEMPELALDPETRKLLVASGFPLEASHRHFSHLMAIHPLGQIRWENGREDQETIRASLNDLERLGTDYWTGYSFSWLASLAARARDGEAAESALEIFSTAFCLRSGFHCNGDQSGKGYSRFTYRPFTLEGNFAAAAGIQEMLLQSHAGAILVFPAVPESWRDASFHTLRAEGAFLVSAERQNGRTRWVRIRSEKGGVCLLEDPFAGEEFETSGMAGHEVNKAKGVLSFALDPGQEATLTARR